ncbi:UPF0235 protein C15orf40 homolog [Folsomia candida]|uniref:Uncharacterized protein n=1 Tax=Folsomia candida TaxID=158441 RepID=A0A226F178_FOLCA|nr:UPF0235 protein C15orf40 homolog [Folsomia candida]OXA63184.1 hypothetical protein Fcan01_03445 [Folsomia candida]
MKINLKLVEINCITKAVPGLCGFSSMGKSAGVNKGQTSKNASASTSIPTKGPINQTKEGHFSITIQVKPGAKVNSITGISEEAVSIQIAAPPVDGEANIAIVKYFSTILNLKKADVSLRGGKSRQKTVTVDSSTGLSIEKILEMLKSQAE